MGLARYAISRTRVFEPPAVLTSRAELAVSRYSQDCEGVAFFADDLELGLIVGHLRLPE